MTVRRSVTNTRGGAVVRFADDLKDSTSAFHFDIRRALHLSAQSQLNQWSRHRLATCGAQGSGEGRSPATGAHEKLLESVSNYCGKRRSQSDVHVDVMSVETFMQQLQALNSSLETLATIGAVPSIGEEAMVIALERVYQALQPGGWLIVGLYPPPPDELGQLLTQLQPLSRHR